MKIRTLLSAPDKWTQNTFARNDEGKPTRFEAGVCWCLLGAVRYCYGAREDASRVEDRIRAVIQRESITGWNDDPKRKFEGVKKIVEELDI